MSSRLHQSHALAVDGGDPVRTAPLPGWPRFSADEIRAVQAALSSGRVNYWTGDQGRAFEREYAAAVGAGHGIAVANGTVALELALRALGVGPGDEVIVPSRTFMASASCVATVGARPVFADVDPDSGNLTARTAQAAITGHTRAVIAVHLGGWPVDMDPLMHLARDAGLAVVEDCAQAHGACYRGRPVGGFGDVAAWSFCQDKILTTAGEGGFVTTGDRAVWRHVWSYKDHGKDPDLLATPHDGAGFRWTHTTIGTNARMHELAAAAGRVALRSLPDWVRRRRENGGALLRRLGALPQLRVPLPPDEPDTHASYYRAYAYLRPETLRPGWDRDRVLRAIRAEGIPCSVGSCGEVYRERAFAGAGPGVGRLPVAARLADTSLAFLVHPTLTLDDMRDAADAAEKVLSAASV
ncbi:putative PLP-dependent enzyme [Frankia sp. EI5c]|uniref:DegT/DnrJ/EryC1/StrS family aminotransferase n=1 Tax=Frankia sp. EI5c TaxID=683316 RepID=UPI0007C3E5AA|nr:DegT/DnrJ/EryC1/StrS aminotransferase family protein [Frankia sp. EI5c]OAA19007.1 putative PLP-dependent enzyme [Frankia sp. EI5c]